MNVSHYGMHSTMCVHARIALKLGILGIYLMASLAIRCKLSEIKIIETRDIKCIFYIT